MAAFRNIFSTIKNPPYCQIAMKNGVIQNWGLVEFFDAETAELTQEKVQGHELNGFKIRVSFCIPGVNAINIYMAVVNAKDDVKTKKALLEDAPSSSVYTQLQKLAAQNPACKFYNYFTLLLVLCNIFVNLSRTVLFVW